MHQYIKNELFYLGISIAFWFLNVPVSKAQESSLLFYHYNVQNGLINNNIEYLHCDSEGFVWFGTANGLQRFDGLSFTDFDFNPGDTSSISGIYIACIAEDSNKNIWVGTANSGLNIFNKQYETFKQYIHNSNYNSLTSNNIPAAKKVMAIENKDYLWVNTDNGLNKINVNNGNIENYYGDFAGQIYFDAKENAIWILSDKIKKFNLHTKRLEYVELTKQQNSKKALINTAIIDKKGALWVGTNLGISIYTKNKVISLVDYLKAVLPVNESNYKWASLPITSIFEDVEGQVWFAIQNKIYILNTFDGTYRILINEPENQNSILDAEITGIYGKNDGIVWVTYLNNGVSKLNISKKLFKTIKQNPSNPKSINGKSIRSVFKDKKNNLWIGTYNNGLNRVINDDYENVYHYNHIPSDSKTLKSNYITAIFVDSKERLWVGSFNDGLCYADNIYLNANLKFNQINLGSRFEIHEFTEDTFGRIWISTQKGLFIYDRNTNLFEYYGEKSKQLPGIKEFNIQSLTFESPNIIWMATWNNGFCKLTLNSDSLLSPKIENDQLTTFNIIADLNKKTINKGFVTLYKDNSGTIWLGSLGDGLIKVIFNNNSVVFKKYDKQNGAPDNSVFGIAGDNFGKIWISTNHGIGMFNPENEQFTNYYEGDGLQSNSFLWDAACQSNQGEIFFGGINGLNAFFPENFTEKYPIPTTYITKLIINNNDVLIGELFDNRMVLEKSIRYTKKIILTHKANVVSLEFMAFDAANQNELLYMYQLEGFDAAYIKTTSDKRFVSYTNLDPGVYKFNVKAANSYGVWNEIPTVLEIQILAPWWKTSWAYFFYLIIFVLILILFRKSTMMKARLTHDLYLEHHERAREKELYQTKLKFFTNISHEFRTPLTLILGPLEKIMDDNRHNDLLKKQISIVKRNADRLYGLIDQLMDFRKIDAGVFEFNPVEADIYHFIVELFDQFEEKALHKNINYNIQCIGTPVQVWFDKDKLEKIIVNLLSNAFKFTSANGEILLLVSFDSTTTNSHRLNFEKDKSNDNTSGFVNISIIDNGIGIPTNDLKHIFERFYQADNSKYAIQGGTGIGLALSKELVDLHKGEIFVESNVAHGSTFTVQLPIKPTFNYNEHSKSYNTSKSNFKSDATIIQKNEFDDSIPLLKDNETKESSPYKKTLILIVEDDREIATFISESLEFQFIRAENGNEGLKMAIDNNPDLIISDVMMPEMDGMELCSLLKTNLKTSHIPVIILSAKTSVENQIEGLDNGADIYITKPFSIKLLDVQIKKLLESRKKLRDEFSRKIVLEPSEITITSTDEIFLRNAIRIVELHIENPDFSIENMSSELGLSRSHLHRKLKVLTAQSASEFIRLIRLKRAIQLLQQSSYSIDEITYKVGFNSPSYFTKCFRQQFGIPPTEYRNK